MRNTLLKKYFSYIIILINNKLSKNNENMRNENEKSFAEEKNKRNHSPGREMCKLNYVCFILIQSHRSVNGQRQGAGLPVPTDVKLQHFKPIYKFYRQLSCTSSPVSQYDMVHFLHILR